ncbi:hypothetical protein [Methylobacterium radiotolerans]|uniref:hypothetical protein n=1 Tax=Methylobacterium radiotolerans TaxID=31998 RepID=UPI001F27D09C|nr:hypothetical protein [Methylobacterium radiotolerans]UIY44102.1 hypothetical protein LZ599_10625 [Methylobacterium radiotolerans]
MLLSLATSVCATAAMSQPVSEAAGSFPFDNQTFAGHVTDLLAAKGLRGSFQRGNCQNTDRDGNEISSCNYHLYSLLYRLWWPVGSDRVSRISARPSYNSRYELSNTAVLGLSAVIAAVEATDDDATVLSISDRLLAAGRTLGGTSVVQTSHARYELSLGKDGYAFEATAPYK